MTRSLLRLSGPDARSFLQGLVTNDVEKIDQGAVYAAILTPQGKYLADFFLFGDEEGVLLDVDADLSMMLLQRLKMYKLRANVEIALVENLYLHRGVDACPADGWADPRNPAMGWRAWRSDAPSTPDTVDWDALHIAHMVPKSGVELTGDSFILECNFEAINGVDFRKGCYVGQEVTARMKHKTELRKGLAQVEVTGAAKTGDEITAGEKAVGTLLTRAGDTALAYLRFDRATGDMQAGDAIVRHK